MNKWQKKIQWKDDLKKFKNEKIKERMTGWIKNKWINDKIKKWDK